MRTAIRTGIYYQGQMSAGKGEWTSATPITRSLNDCIEDMEAVGFKPWDNRNTSEARIVRMIVEEV